MAWSLYEVNGSGDSVFKSWPHTKKVLKQKLISGRFYGRSVLSNFALSAVVWPGASMRPMVREVLRSNPGTDKKSVRT